MTEGVTADEFAVSHRRLRPTSSEPLIKEPDPSWLVCPLEVVRDRRGLRLGELPDWAVFDSGDEACRWRLGVGGCPFPRPLERRHRPRPRRSPRLCAIFIVEADDVAFGWEEPAVGVEEVKAVGSCIDGNECCESEAWCNKRSFCI